MPSLPTSLIVVGLVAAWLVVLVPMVARRREHVPDSEDGSAGFRVLRRASQSLRRRRPVMSRTAVADGEDVVGDGDEDGASGIDEDSAVDDYDDAGDLDGDTGHVVADVADDAGAVRARDREGERYGAGDDDDDAGFGERSEAADARDDESGAVTAIDDDEQDAPVGGRSERGERLLRPRSDDRGRRGAQRPRRAPVASYRQPECEEPRAEEPRYDEPRYDESRYDERGYDEPQYDERGYDEPQYEDSRYAPPVTEDLDHERTRPVPVRPGRGGFDPKAAEQAKAFRYRQRRRVALVLLAISAVCAVFGVLGVSLAWVGAVGAFVLLALYLAYLRRQVRIEETIRQRRAARLERARQIRPVYRASVAEQVRAHRSGSLPRPDADDEPVEGYRVRSHARPTVPPTYHTRGVPVDLDDDDPAFEDLEYYRPVAYRRAVGE